MKSADRLREAKKQLTIVADDEELSEIQQRTAAHLGGLVGAFGDSLAVLEDAELVADGGREITAVWLVAIADVADRWDITPDESESFLHSVGFQPRHGKIVTDGGFEIECGVDLDAVGRWAER